MLTLDYTPAADRFTARLRAYAQRVETQSNNATRDRMVHVRQVVIDTSPEDTRALKQSWSPVTQRGLLRWGISNPKTYGPILEYGGYRGVGLRTVALGGGTISEDFTAGGGIYSTQAPLGWVRKALAAEKGPWLTALRAVLRQNWEGPGTGQRLVMNTSDMASVFGVRIGA